MNKIIYYLTIWLSAILLFYPLTSYSDDTEYEVDGIVFRAHPTKKPINDAHLTLLNFTIGKETIKEIQKQLGKSKEIRNEDCSAVRICYRSRNDGAFIVFESGAMGGWNDLTSFYLTSKRKYITDPKSCKEIIIRNKLQTRSELKIGMSKQEIEDILGVPNKRISNDFFYVYESMRRMTDAEIKRMMAQWPNVVEEPYFSVESFIHAKFEKGRLFYLSISSTESY